MKDKPFPRGYRLHILVLSCLLFIPFRLRLQVAGFFVDLRIIIIVRWPDKTRIAIRQRDVQEIMRLRCPVDGVEQCISGM